ncbi:MAG TPA: 50S ribosomal protein L9 [Burkholderiales bacterium]|nr:50S ribosomal protein L9 [Burkholderiales bacterium]
MQVILLEKVTNLGQLGDVVRVKDGYGRNYLIPKGKAKRATTANLAEFETRRHELEKVQANVLVNARARAASLEGVRIEIVQKAGVDGRLFGSVGATDIVESLKAKGIEVDKHEIRMPEGHFKQVGEYDVVVSLHADVQAKVIVAVIAES